MKHRGLSFISQPSNLFLLLASCFGLLYVWVTPPLWGLDETAHFSRVYQLTHGEIVPHRTDVSIYGVVPTNLNDFANFVKVDLIDNRGQGVIRRKDTNHASEYERHLSQHFSKEQHQSSGAASYSPVPYFGAAIGTLLADLCNASIGNTILLARIFSLLVYVVLVWLSLRLLNHSKLKWLLFTVALLPTCVFQAATVGADGVAIGLSLVFMALLIRLWQAGESNQSTKLFYALVLVGALLPLVKPNYIFLSAGLLLIPNKVFKKTKYHALIFKSAGLILTAVGAIIWSLMVKVLSDPKVSERPDGAKVVTSDQIAFVLHHPIDFLEACARSILAVGDSYLQSMIGLMGWNYISIPSIFLSLLYFAMLIAALSAKAELVALKKKLVLLNVFGLLGVMSIFGSLYVAFTPTGNFTVDGVQGRYFLPFLLPVVMLLGAYLPFSFKIVKAKLVPVVFGMISAVCLMVSVVYYLLATY